MYILGISDSHVATATLLKDGEIIACASEERFCRVKNKGGMPEKSIAYCLQEGKITPSQIDFIIVAGQTFPPLIYQSETKKGKASAKPDSPSTKLYYLARHFHYFFLRQKLERRLPLIRGFNDFFYQLGIIFLASKFVKERAGKISQILAAPREKIFFVDHHLCHAYAALYSSPFPKEKKPALVFTLDCQGDKLSGTVSLYKNGQLKRLSETSMNDSLGALYTEMTIFLGMKPNDHEYKVMGLAPYAPDKGVAEVLPILKELIWFDKKSLTFKSKLSSENFSLFLREKLAGYRFDYLAGAIQKLTEELLVDWVKTTVKRYKISTIACGGGVFMNVKANQKIAAIREVKKAFFMPSAGDESNAIGACFWGFIHKLKNKSLPQPLNTLYLGPQFSNREIEEIIRKKKLRRKYKVEKHQNIEGKIASLLTYGEIVAVFKGRMEWGARALGNRSILANAANLDVKEEINKMIKQRDFWMPFAPVILDRWQAKYLVNPKKFSAPYMILAFDSKNLAQKHLQAAMHPYDKTLRPQVIKRKQNPSLYKILEIFEKRTGMGGLLNTSFNIHGEPIVCSPQDAIHTFENSGLKYLAINNFLISKN